MRPRAFAKKNFCELPEDGHCVGAGQVEDERQRDATQGAAPAGFSRVQEIT
jgi:hypothetical protein